MNDFENKDNDFTPSAPQEVEEYGSSVFEDTANDARQAADEQGENYCENGYAQNDPTFDNVEDSAPVWNKVNYSEVLPIEDYKPSNKGLRVFALCMAAVILLTASCITGYFFGKNSSYSSGIGAQIELDLASKPKDTDQYTVAQIYDKLDKSIVGIRVYNSQGKMSDASGVIYSEDGYVITNDHIYSEIGGARFRVYMHDGAEYDAEYVAGDVISDLAVIKIDSNKKFEPCTLGNSNELVCGEGVVAIGRPNDAMGKSSVTSGIISLTKLRITGSTNYSSSVIQTDSAINPGSSGGALVNMYGQVIGITSAKLTGEEYDAVGFAIPTITVKRVVEQLIEYGQVKDRAKLGITYSEVNSVVAEIAPYSAPGLLVQSVSEDSDISGKVVAGDIITHVNGTAITDADIILDIIENSVAGDTITLTVLTTKGQSVDYSVTLKANVGESSYNDKESSSQNSGGIYGGTFDFPQGE